MKRLLLLLQVSLLFSCAEKKPRADMVILGGKIYTVDKGNPQVEAVAVVGDTIVYAGNLSGVEEFKDEKTQIINLEGRTMTPGFIEGHGHFFGVGYFEIDLEIVWNTLVTDLPVLKKEIQKEV